MPELAEVDIYEYCVGLDDALASLEGMDAALHDMHGPLETTMGAFHTHTREWIESAGEGTYDPLSPSTLREKERLGFPPDPLIRSGELLESAAGHGPFSYGDVLDMEGEFGLEWLKDGYNIAALHQSGVPWREVTQHRHSRRDGHEFTVHFLWHLPARPIFEIDDGTVDTGADAIIEHVLAPFD